MKVDTKRLFKKSVAIVTLFCMATQTTFAALLTLAQVPLFIGATPPPQVMLTISKDQQMHYKAYTDYADLDGDGLLDITYKHTITYYGYFDPIKCYNYDTGLERFAPIAVSPGNNKYCETVAGGRWSGNFLNWISMSRMDTIRKLLYGGFRSTDTANLTVLERNIIPTDAHAWAKYYNGTDINRLTPHNPPITAPSGVATGSSDNFSTDAAQAINTTTPKHFRNVATSVCLGDQVKVAIDSSNYVVGYVSVVDTSGDCSTAGSGAFSLEVDPAGVVGTGAGSATAGFYTVSNLSGAGISFCNLTGATNGTPISGTSHVKTDPPIIRVARGNFGMWANNDIVQCQWKVGNHTFGLDGSNGNIGALSGSATLPVGSVSWASAFEPLRTTHGLLSGGGAVGTPDMVARVEVCNSKLLGSEKCKQYNQANVFKPIGLLQQYGDPNLIHFGLLTNSYAMNKSGGVLRKNVGTLNNEIAVDGTFLNPAAGSIITAMNNLKIFGYSYSSKDYLAGDNCGSVTSTGGNSALNRGDAEEGRCTNWGDPIAEMYLESVRYFAGKAATPGYGYKQSGSRDESVGLPQATWTDPLNSNNFCAPLNVLVFNPGTGTFDRDQLGGVSDIAGAGSNTAISLTNAVGAAEGINGKPWFVGNSPADPTDLCTGKSNVMFGEIYGLCPQAPRGQGSYLIAGIAHLAKHQSHPHRYRRAQRRRQVAQSDDLRHRRCVHAQRPHPGRQRHRDPDAFRPRKRHGHRLRHRRAGGLQGHLSGRDLGQVFRAMGSVAAGRRLRPRPMGCDQLHDLRLDHYGYHRRHFRESQRRHRLRLHHQRHDQGRRALSLGIRERRLENQLYLRRSDLCHRNRAAPRHRHCWHPEWGGPARRSIVLAAVTSARAKPGPRPSLIALAHPPRDCCKTRCGTRRNTAALPTATATTCPTCRASGTAGLRTVSSDRTAFPTTSSWWPTLSAWKPRSPAPSKRYSRSRRRRP